MSFTRELTRKLRRHPFTDSFALFGTGVSGVYASKRMHAGGCVDVRSITKSVVALAVLKLHTTNRLRLTDHLRAHLPASAAGGVTLDQLLTHTAGLRDASYLYPGTRPYDFDDDFAIAYDPAECHRATADGAAWQPGMACDGLSPHAWALNHPSHGDLAGTFKYSNAGYQLLAAVVEAVAGAPIDVFCRAELWGGWGAGRIGWHRTRGAPLGQSGLCVTAEALAVLGERLLHSPDLEAVRRLAWDIRVPAVPGREVLRDRFTAYGRGFWLTWDGTEALGLGSQSNYWLFDVPRSLGVARLHLSGTQVGDSYWEASPDYDSSLTDVAF